MSGSKQNSLFLYILTNPDFRLGRYVIMWFTIVIFASSEVAYNYSALLSSSYSIFIRLIAVSFLTKLAFAYCVFFVLTPRFLLRRKYMVYLAGIVVFALLAQLLQLVMEKAICVHYGIDFLRSPSLNIVYFLDLLSQSSIFIMSIIGGSISFLLRYWMAEKQRIHELETEHVRMEAEQLKEQITSALLFSVLHMSGTLAKTESARASGMLMELSRLLRYQLYDCRRQEVLLDSEIKFITNYLTLSGQCGRSVDFSITTEGKTLGLFVPPLLFISFVQQIVWESSKSPESLALSIRLMHPEGKLSFGLESPGIHSDEDFSKIRRRLDGLYRECYMLSVSPGQILLCISLNKSYETIG